MMMIINMTLRHNSFAAVIIDNAHNIISRIKFITLMH